MSRGKTNPLHKTKRLANTNLVDIKEAEQTPIKVYNGDKLVMTYYQNDKEEFHRLDGPAVIWPDGKKEHYINGKRTKLEE